MMLDDFLMAEHQLLRELGGMTLSEMEERMSAEEFRWHQAYWKRVNAEAQRRR